MAAAKSTDVPASDRFDWNPTALRLLILQEIRPGLGRVAEHPESAGTTHRGAHIRGRDGGPDGACDCATTPGNNRRCRRCPHLKLALNRLVRVPRRINATGADKLFGHRAATVGLVVAWEVLDPPAQGIVPRQFGVDDATWLRGRAWALSITLMIWYYWTTMPERRASRMILGRNVLADAGYSV